MNKQIVECSYAFKSPKETHWVATKKGIIITVAILAAISSASFVVWLLPQNHGSSLVVSDYKSELDSVKERHSLITIAIESNLKGLSDKNMHPDDFINQTRISSSQITSLISELIESNPPLEWKQSYGAYFEALKKYNDYLTETVSLANKIKDGKSASDLNEEMLKLDALKKESDSLVTKSDQTRP
jgi:hypothetical protein